MTLLPSSIDSAAFDALHDDPAAWRGLVEALAGELGLAAGDLRQETAGTVLVARLGHDRLLKVYPPFLRDHFEFERAMLGQLQGRLSVPTPGLLASGERDGWPFLVMTQLRGTPLDAVWPQASEANKCELLRRIGTLACEVHALPAQAVQAAAPHAPAWGDFVARQRVRCVERQRRTGLPAHLLAQVPDFVAGALPEGPDVLLTGEYTPFNLFAARVGDGWRLAAMFDFGDGLVGPREYDALGPQCFLVAGDPARAAALDEGLGATIDAAMRLN